jgi:hypothetical protein
MAEPIEIDEQLNRLARQHIAGRGGPPYDGEMEHRLTALETKIETILPTLATKADVADAKSNIVQWVAGIGFAIVAIIVSVMAFMLNRALPPQSAGAGSPQPIVINVPAQQAPAPAAAAPAKP